MMMPLLSKPEILLLQSAEENPLEYTLAEWEDAFLLVRVLLKLLDQMTGPSDGVNGMVSTSELGRLNATGRHTVLSEEEAMEVLAQDKIGVMTHYVITRLYDMMGLLAEKEQKRMAMPPTSREDLRVSILTLFFHPCNNKQPSCPRLMDDWRPLLRILYRSGSDDYTKRGAALVLAYILKAGCSLQGDNHKQSRRKRDDTLLLPPLEHEQNGGTQQPTAITNNNQMVTETLQSLISWLTSQLQSSHDTPLGVVTPTLMILATTTQARRAFDQAGGIGYLTRHIKQFHQNHQRQKQLRKKNRTSQKAKKLLYTRSLSLPENQSNKKQDDLVPTSIQSVSHAVSKAAQRLRSNNPTSPTAARARRNVSSANGNNHSDDAFFSNSAASPSSTHVPRISHSSGSFVSQIASMVRESAPVTLTAMLGAASSVLDTNGSAHGSPPPASPSRASLRNSIARSNTNSSSSSSSRNRSPSSLNNTSNNLLSTSSSSSSFSSVQQLYELVFALWCMTLDCYPNCDGRNNSIDADASQQVRQHFARDGAVPALVQLLQTAPREKVLRLAVASLRTLATLDDVGGVVAQHTSFASNSNPASTAAPATGSAAFFVREMIACDVQKGLDFLHQRHWNDPDLQDDLDALSEIIQHHTRELTQWKVYQAEVDTGVLRWDSHFHTSDFFRQNALSMEGPNGNFAPLTKLVQILYRHTKLGKSSMSSSRTYYVGLKEVAASSSCGNDWWDEDTVDDDELCQTLAVALYDIGEFARHYPNGRAVIAAAGRQQSVLGKTKDLVMQYMQYPREEVQEQALSCASKLLVKNWRAIGLIQDE
jgi:V-type H+-transporting ATPase subunit H